MFKDISMSKVENSSSILNIFHLTLDDLSIGDLDVEETLLIYEH